jgi:hypothetical protein
MRGRLVETSRTARADRYFSAFGGINKTARAISARAVFRSVLIASRNALLERDDFPRLGGAIDAVENLLHHKAVLAGRLKVRRMKHLLGVS